MSIYGEEYGQTIIPGELGSTALTQSQDNSGNTGSLGNSAGGDGAFVGEGVRSGIDSWDKAYTDAGGKLPSRFGLSDLKQFATDNKSWLAGAGALASVYGGGTNADKKTGYQGVIPQLSASRKMITAPPTRAQGYRPGAGGIDYGGDVTYALAPGQDPWANLSGTSGSSLTDLINRSTNTSRSTSTSTSIRTSLSTSTSTSKTTGTGTSTSTGTGTGTNLGSSGYQWATQRLGWTPAQYLNSINQWIIDNPNASKAQIDAALNAGGVSQADLQEALRTSTFSDATKYALTHGGSFQQQAQIIEKWLRDNPYATAAQIQTAMDKVHLNDEDIARGMYGLNSSAAKEYAVVHDMGLDQLYRNILDYQAAGHSKADVDAVMSKYGIEQRDINAANKYAADTGYEADATSYAGVGDYSDLDSGGGDSSGGLDTGNDIYEYFASPEIQEALASGDVADVLGAISEAGWSAADIAEATGVSEASVQAQIDAASGYAAGGEIAMAKGRYLQGGTDGMADELPARIGKDQPAALSHGEFVIPADVVSHMGNGNSDAGAKKLYQMMDKIRMARTGNKKQGKKINPDKFMPGGLAQAYASGGEVKRFQEGGLTTANKNASMGISGVESNLSNWAGPYVTNMLGQGQALANMPYQAYMGPLTSGESPLQTGAFTTAGSLTTPTSIGNAATTAGGIATKAADLTYKPTTSAFDATQAQTYMNPYLQSSLTPQLEEARRQSQITQQQNAAKMTQAGAFGGSRQAILDAETQRNLGSNLANITGTGYNTAYDKAMAQFNADQARKAQENQFGATYGLQGLQTGLQAAQAQGGLGATEASTGLANLNAQLSAGAQQRGIESEGIAADKAQFEEARANPYKMVQYQQSLLQGLPLAAQSYQGIEPSALLKASQGATTVNALLKNLGLI
jgi:hypothetical protein